VDCTERSLHGRRLKGKGKGVLGAAPKLPFPSLSNACHAGYTERGGKQVTIMNKLKKR